MPELQGYELGMTSAQFECILAGTKQLFSVEVPAGMEAGQLLLITAPDGRYTLATITIIVYYRGPLVTA